MKRDYFGIIFILVSLALIFITSFIFDPEVVFKNISRFIIIWLLIAFYAGQYSIKLPKAF